MSNSSALINASVPWVRRISIYLLCLLLAPCIFTSIGHTQPHLVFVVGENEYRSEVTMPALAQVLADHYGFRTTILIDDVLQGGEANSINGLDALETADLLVLYLRFRQLPDAQLALLQKYIDRGGPIVAFRTTTHAFDYEAEDQRATWWNNFGARELGGTVDLPLRTRGKHRCYNHWQSSYPYRCESRVPRPFLDLPCTPRLPAERCPGLSAGAPCIP